ncbi:MAG: CBS domain-containing protein [Planctomycetota bacterium]
MGRDHYRRRPAPPDDQTRPGRVRARIRADALAAEATAIFHKYRIDDLPVVDAEDRPVGLIDVQDIVTIKVVG